MKTGELISTLSADCRPLRRATSPRVASLIWTFSGLLWSALILAILGVRPGIRDLPLKWFYAGEIVILILLAHATIFSVASLRIPGEEVSRPWRWIVPLVAVWGLYLLGGTVYWALAYGSADLWPVDGESCAFWIGGLFVIPSAFLLTLARRGWPAHAKWISTSILAAGATLSTLGIEAYCKHESTTHHLSYHLLPVVIISGCGWLLGSLLGLSPFRLSSPARSHSLFGDDQPRDRPDSDRMGLSKKALD